MGANTLEPAGSSSSTEICAYVVQSKSGTSDVVRLPHQVSPSFINYTVTYSKIVNTQKVLKQTYIIL
jgi:hypothetical protein